MWEKERWLGGWLAEGYGVVGHTGHTARRPGNVSNYVRTNASDFDAVLDMDLVTYRDVTLDEASKYFKILRTTLSDWWRSCSKILANETRDGVARWLEIEEQPYQRFCKQRQQGEVVSIG